VPSMSKRQSRGRHCARYAVAGPVPMAVQRGDVARTMPSDMSRRDQQIMFGLAILSVAFAVLQSLTGLNPDVLLAAPALLLFLPLLAGRYVGEEGLLRVAARARAPRVRAVSSLRPVLRPPRALARGGRLIAAALAERAPPAPLLAR
jgi:hypothetical protein